MSKNRSQVLPFTLTEIFVLLFFALALALAKEAYERQQAEATVDENRELLAAVAGLSPAATRHLVSILKQADDEVPEDFDELTRMLEEEGEAREELMEALVASGMDSTRVASAPVSELVDSIRSYAERNRARYEALVEASGVGEDQRRATEALADSISRLTEEKAHLTGQLQYFRNRVGNGLDHPPCWATEQGEIEYAFQATLRTETVDLRSIWPSYRDDDARDIPGMSSAAGSGMGYTEFSRRVLPIFVWSTQQTPECRHFVVIVDSVAGGKEPFKRGLLTVERFFYKRLEN